MITQFITETDMTLVLKRVFEASRERVFKAWTEPDSMKRWMSGPHLSDPVTEVDLRVGGNFRVQMKGQDTPIFWVSGTYREIEPPERLVYTWRFDGLAFETGETLVTVDFHERNGATEVVMRQERFPDNAVRDIHQVGWTALIERLAAIVEGES